MLNVLVGLENSMEIRMKRIVLGEASAYYAHYHEGTLQAKCYCASNLSHLVFCMRLLCS